MIAKVVVYIGVYGLEESYDYIIPKEFESELIIGCRVVVPFGTQKRMGFVIAVGERSQHKKLKAIDSILDRFPLLNEELILLGRWMAYYYISALGKIFQTMLPSMLKITYHKIVRCNEERLAQELLFLTNDEEELLQYFRTNESVTPELLKTFSHWQESINYWFKTVS